MLPFHLIQFVDRSKIGEKNIYLTKFDQFPLIKRVLAEHGRQFLEKKLYIKSFDAGTSNIRHLHQNQIQ